MKLIIYDKQQIKYWVHFEIHSYYQYIFNIFVKYNYNLPPFFSGICHSMGQAIIFLLQQLNKGNMGNTKLGNIG